MSQYNNLTNIRQKEKHTMNTAIRLILVSIMMMFLSAPAYSSSVVHVFGCSQDEEASDEDVAKVATAWLKAAKQQKGGENMEAAVFFPIAAQVGENDFRFVIKVPTFAEWGLFIDGYEGSPASKIDAEFEDIADCPSSSLWEAVKLK